MTILLLDNLVSRVLKVPNLVFGAKMVWCTTEECV